MDNNFFKTPAAIIACMVLLSGSSCSDLNEPVSSGSAENDGIVPLVIKGLPILTSSGETSEKLQELKVFHFKGDSFLKVTTVEDPYAESTALPTEGTSDILCVSGIDLNAVKDETTRSAFYNSVVGSGADSAPLFYSGCASFNDQTLHNGQIEVDLARSVARIDFANEADPSVKISKVIVMDAPASSFVFEHGSTPSDATVSYTKDFSEPFQGTVAGLFTIFESEKPVEIRILGEYGDSPLNVLTVLPKVERNRIYTLQMVNMESKTESLVTVKEWEAGSQVEASPNIAKGIFINKENSSVPQGVTVDYRLNQIKVPASGTNDLKLAFLSSDIVNIAKIEGQTNAVKITPNQPVKISEGYISSFNLDIAAQPNGGVAYSVIVHLKDASGNYNFVEISVPDHHYIATVEMAGLTWMAFNAVSDDLGEQIFPADGLSVEETYQKHWAYSLGNFFQYGRKKGYSPWERNDPNGNESTPRNIPWRDPECVPLPSGYHVATNAEWLKLLPNGTTIPSTYTAANGEQIKSEVIELPGTLDDSPSANANKANLRKRYVRFESLDTHNVLIFPVCALKGNNWDEYPSGGRKMHDWVSFWIAEDRYVWLFQVDANLNATQRRDRWNYNGFIPVRGVKD